MDAPFSSSLFSLSTTPFVFVVPKPKPKPVCFRRGIPRLCLAATAAAATTTTTDCEIEVENRKLELLRAVTDTKRGLTATPHQRSVIEEAQVNVESLDAGKGKGINFDLLEGTWRLQYTSAPDVLILFQSAATIPFFQVDQIYQKFECNNQSDQGVVRNIIRWSIPKLLEARFQAATTPATSGENQHQVASSTQEQEGATLIVSAKFSAVSIRNIYLQFEQIAVQNINISEELQGLLAPAILPRSFLSLQILQFIRSFQAQFPVRSSPRQSVGGLYYLSYLDSNMLLGRAVGGGGVFVFTRAQAFI